MKKLMNKKGLVIFTSGAIVILLTIVASITIYTSITKLTNEEQTVLNCLQSLQRSLKNPDSLKLYEDIILANYSQDAKDSIYVYILYGGTNSYGAIVKSIATYADNDYIGDLNEALDINDYKFENASDTERKNMIELLKANVPYNLYKIQINSVDKKYSKECTEMMKKLKTTVVNKDKMLKRLKIEK
jgi:hypothetical protein